ncbi:MAG: SMC-Scp complex subunit ScpB [Rhodospirillaceae bacterium]|nr:SMC-Scp complex subunit ScpB [Rhodospirillaceae bacterium]
MSKLLHNEIKKEVYDEMIRKWGEPLTERDLASRLPEDADIIGLLEELKSQFANRGVHLTSVGAGWAFRTAPDLAAYMEIEKSVVRRLSRAAVETLAIVAYHQPVTRAEIEEIRGVSLSRGTLDILLEAGWIRPRGRRRVPGKPITWGTSDAFLDHFGLESLNALPGVEELKAAGLLDKRQSWSTSLDIDETEEGEPYEAVETDDAIAFDE